MINYPYSTPMILTDPLYLEYGGHVKDSSPAQRQAAYLIAEKQMTSHLSTFLPITTVTGSFPWPMGGHVFVTPYGHVHSIDDVTVYSQSCLCDCDLISSDGCGFIHDDTYGYILVREVEGCLSSCGCHSSPPYQFRLTFTAGLGSGTCYQADMLLGLTIAAELALNEIVDPGANEGAGDIGVQQFSNQSYTETRVRLKRTAFGTSARANYVANPVNSYRHYRALKL